MGDLARGGGVWPGVRVGMGKGAGGEEGIQAETDIAEKEETARETPGAGREERQAAEIQEGREERAARREMGREGGDSWREIREALVGEGGEMCRGRWRDDRVGAESRESANGARTRQRQPDPERSRGGADGRWGGGGAKPEGSEGGVSGALEPC